VTAINHALTGATIGLLSGEPLLAIPLALVSHFICDALPHFGIEENQKRWLRSNVFRNYLITDSLACIGLVGVLAALQPVNWQLAALCAFLATSPDFLWIPKFLAAKGKSREWTNVYTRFASGIQWFQRPIGIVVEVVWLIGFSAIVGQFL
jgi:hypothetical protein